MDEEQAHNEQQLYGDEVYDESTVGRSVEQSLDALLLGRAREMYNDSTNYINTNVVDNWETSLAHFRNQHASGTNYANRDYRRSRTFRPKTRAALKGHEAAIATAAFTTGDLVNVAPQDPLNEQQRASATIVKEVLEYRLAKKMKWFQTVLGAYQDTHVYGICVSHQHWRYETATDYELDLEESGEPKVDEDGNPVAKAVQKPIADEMRCDLIAPENFRFDPNADWRDPVGTSPYLVWLVPMYVTDVLNKMNTTDPKTGQPQWRPHTKAQILTARKEDDNRTRRAREGDNRTDPTEEQAGNEWTVVWAHMNVFREGGVDWMFWTLGTELILTDPVPLLEAYPHLAPGERPFVVGVSTIETHRNYPAGSVEQTSPLQREINDIANQRLDNVKLVLNKRYFVKRGTQVDLEALMRNTPGGGVMMNNPKEDVEVVNTPDVTGSSYMEQDRLSVEFDELAGAFSGSSVQSNRQLNETVGGMSLLNQGANEIQDLSVMIFLETWMEPVLYQLVKLVQYYETDPVILTIAANKAQLFQKFGADALTDDLLRQGLTVTVNVGMGYTDPMRRVEKLLFGVNTVANLPGMVERLKAGEIANEIFGALGHKSADRFFMSDEEFQQVSQQMGEQPPPPEIQLKNRELDIRERDVMLRDERERIALEQEAELTQAKLATDFRAKEEDRQTKRDTAALQAAEKRRDSIQRIAGGNADARGQGQANQPGNPGGGRNR